MLIIPKKGKVRKMKKGIIILSVIFVLMFLSIGIGFYFIKVNQIGMIKQEKDILENSIDEKKVKVVEANAKKIRITPKTKLILKTFYTKCNHAMNSYVELPKELVNMDEEELKKQYLEWNIEKFTEEEVILLKEENAFCNEHYVLKEKDGRIAIFNVNQKGEEILKEITSISTEYLTQNDLLNIRSGIKVYGVEELNKTLEDYE